MPAAGATSDRSTVQTIEYEIRCQTCKNTRTVRTGKGHTVQWVEAKFPNCRACVYASWRGVKKRTSRDVLRRIDTSAGIDACWPWTGAKDQNGYGRISSRTFGESLVHRYVYRLATRNEPGEAVMHECDNPICCNPLHLTAADRLTNNRQAWDRGLHQRGEKHVHARLTNAQVTEIRELVSNGHRQSDVARKYGVGQSHVSRIVNRKVRKGD